VVRVSFLPFLMGIPSGGRVPRRIFGPCRSWMIPTVRLCFFAAFRTFPTICLKFLYVPCEKLSLATSMPPRTRSSITEKESELGPSVATIFV